MGYGAALGVVLAAFTYTGGKLTGYERDPAVDEVSRKEYLRKNRRRPVDEIVNELGEGRGMCWACDAMQTRSFHFGSHLLIDMQEFTRPATRSVGHSASRPTTALMFPPLLLRKYVSYTHNTIFHVRRSAIPLSELSYLLCHGSGPHWGHFQATIHLAHYRYERNIDKVFFCGRLVLNYLRIHRNAHTAFWSRIRDVSEIHSLRIGCGSSLIGPDPMLRTA